MLWRGFLLCAVVTTVLSAGSLEALAETELDITIHYVTRSYEQPLPLSLLEDQIKDEGIQGARLANQENQETGRFLKQKYSLVEHVVPLDEPFLEAVLPAFADGAHFIVADLETEDLLALADSPETADDLILNTRSHEDQLRIEECRKNVWHVAPSWIMKADGLAQYLVWKRWTKWFLLRGRKPKDIAYADAIERAAKKFGAEIVERREYQFEAGSRRVESGHQQIQTQMPLFTQGAKDHDVVVVSDVEESFGEYLPYRTYNPRPVVGTHGLVSAAWHRSYEHFGSMSLHSAFERLAGRNIRARDYLNWLAVKAIAETIIRGKSSEPSAVKERFLDEKFKIPGFKGIGLSFRPWNQQLRQPMLIAWNKALVSMSPQDGFLHEHHTLDSLGFGRTEGECRLNPDV